MHGLYNRLRESMQQQLLLLLYSSKMPARPWRADVIVPPISARHTASGKQCLSVSHAREKRDGGVAGHTYPS